MASSPLLYGRVVHVTIDAPTETTTYTNDSLEIHFEVNFDDDEKPNQNYAQIYNLSPSSLSKIRKGYNISISAGYKGEYGLLSSGKITSVTSVYETADKVTTINFNEGTDYSSGSTKNITFRNGTRGSQIISKLVSTLGIKLAQLSLPYNKVYKTGFKVTGTIEDKLLQVVQDCGAVMYWRRGSMVIRSIKAGDDERFQLDESTGLIEPPQPVNDTSIKGWSVRCLLQHRISTASIIQLKSSSVNGQFRAKIGKHYYDGNDFLSEFTVV